MSQKDYKEKRIETLKQAQAGRKEDALARVYKAIDALQKTGAKITFSNVARQANVSTSYLYKYPELKQYVAQLRNQQSPIPRQFDAKSGASDAQVKIISRLKERIRKLEQEKSELRQKNVALAGQVYRVYYLQQQVVRQEQEIQNLKLKLEATHTSVSFTSVTTCDTDVKSYSPIDVLRKEVEQSGVQFSKTLERVIHQYSEAQVLLAIKAYTQYKKTHKIENSGACLRRAIEEGWLPKENSVQRSSLENEFDQFYADAVADGFLLDIPKNHLPIEQGEWIVKINCPSMHSPWTPTNWREAKLEYEQIHLLDG